jgi:hypothetical protein
MAIGRASIAGSGTSLKSAPKRHFFATALSRPPANAGPSLGWSSLANTCKSADPDYVAGSATINPASPFAISIAMRVRPFVLWDIGSADRSSIDVAWLPSSVLPCLGTLIRKPGRSCSLPEQRTNAPPRERPAPCSIGRRRCRAGEPPMRTRLRCGAGAAPPRSSRSSPWRRNTGFSVRSARSRGTAAHMMWRSAVSTASSIPAAASIIASTAWARASTSRACSPRCIDGAPRRS